VVEEGNDTSDGKTSIQLLYWYNPTHPKMLTGKGADPGVDTDLNFGGTSKPSPGGEIAFPIGKYHTLRLSYFRTQGSGDTTAGSLPTGKGFAVWSALFNPGDRLNTTYTLQNGKISLDYTSWPFPVSNARFRVKTLWEVQYTTIKSSVNAPFSPQTDASGNAIQTYGSGSNWFISPTIGLGVEYMATKHFRFEAKGSGFAFPHRWAIADGEAFFAYKAGQIEVDFGAKAFYFKTSPKRAEYIHATLPGAFVGIRWYPK
jgi:hypothetical protein